jgi:hypothetical protein
LGIQQRNIQDSLIVGPFDPLIDGQLADQQRPAFPGEADRCRQPDGGAVDWLTMQRHRAAFVQPGDQTKAERDRVDRLGVNPDHFVCGLVHPDAAGK